VTSTWPERLETERRLLAALYLWPQAVGVDAQDFLAPQHAMLYRAVNEIEPGELASETITPSVRAFVESEAMERRVRRGLETTHAYWVGRWYENYIIETLMQVEVSPSAIPDLVAQVRVCPRCGRGR
jgi:hypothetical protein